MLPRARDLGTMDTYHCVECDRPVTEDEAFLRSVNLESTAWCRPCWFAKNTHLLVPQQRRAPAIQAKPRRRWLPRLRGRSYDEASS